MVGGMVSITRLVFVRAFAGRVSIDSGVEQNIACRTDIGPSVLEVFGPGYEGSRLLIPGEFFQDQDSSQLVYGGDIRAVSNVNRGDNFCFVHESFFLPEGMSSSLTGRLVLNPIPRPQVFSRPPLG